MSVAKQDEVGVSIEDFVYYAFAVTATLYVVAYSIELILKRVSSLQHIDVSLLSRRIAAITIHFMVFVLLAQSLYVLYINNRWLTDNLPPSTSYEYWHRYEHPKSFETDWQKLYFYLTHTDITITGYRQSKILLQLAMTVNAAFNGIDMFLMYFYGKGFSAESSSLLIFHHWTIIWIESCIFNLDLLNFHPDWLWLFSIIGLILIVGCISDLLLAPSTISCFISNDKSMIYKKLLWIHLLFGVIIMRGAGVSMLAFDFVVTMWQMDWKYGAAFQIAIIFMWLQWNNLGKAIWHKISNW